MCGVLGAKLTHEVVPRRLDGRPQRSLSPDVEEGSDGVGGEMEVAVAVTRRHVALFGELDKFNSLYCIVLNSI